MPGSRNEGKVVNANFNPNGNLNVKPNWNPQFRNRNLGARSEEASCYKRGCFKELKYLLVLLIFSIPQAFCQFPEAFVLVARIFYCLMLEHLWQALKVF